ncbi:heme-binding protein [bacterium]|nr:heme-binding protein [bacterium]
MKPIFLIITTLVLSGCSVLGIRTSEEPGFTLLREQDDIQIRQYQSLLVAETEVTADYQESSSIAFRRLAGYIFGKNTRNEKMAMTAPVVQQQESEKIAMTAPVLQQKAGEKWIMAFVLPAKYTMETLPKPLDESVRIRQIPAKKVAAIRYTGRLNENNVQSRSTLLLNWLHKEGYRVLSDPRSAGYDPPWTVPFLRRNEVHIDVE